MRRKHDFYPTPGWATLELLNRIPISGALLEPCVGGGDIADPLEEHVVHGGASRLRTNDLDQRWVADSHDDATRAAWWQSLGPLDWVITNPPFLVADKILPLAVEYARHVAMLLRLSYLEPCNGRGAWLAAYPPTDLIVLPRMSFTGDGKTDSVTCAWMVWREGRSEQTISIVPRPAEQPA